MLTKFGMQWSSLGEYFLSVSQANREQKRGKSVWEHDFVSISFKKSKRSNSGGRKKIERRKKKKKAKKEEAPMDLMRAFVVINLSIPSKNGLES
jgi:hypothetical protein